MRASGSNIFDPTSKATAIFLEHTFLTEGDTRKLECLQRFIIFAQGHSRTVQRMEQIGAALQSDVDQQSLTIDCLAVETGDNLVEMYGLMFNVQCFAIKKKERKKTSPSE